MIPLRVLYYLLDTQFGLIRANFKTLLIKNFYGNLDSMCHYFLFSKVKIGFKIQLILF